MKQPALLLTADTASVQVRSIGRLLQFFGIPQRTTTRADFSSVQSWLGSKPAMEKARLLGAANVLLQLVNDLDQRPDRHEWWRECIHSVFIYPGEDLDALERLLGILTADELARVGSNLRNANFSVSSQCQEICGTMTGLEINARGACLESCFALRHINSEVADLISIGDSAIFVKLEYEGVPIFLSTSGVIIDLDAELASQNFDVREHFVSAVPLVLYIKWAFSKTCWNAPEANACLMIDDPLLKPTHGFVDFQELLALMKQHKFSTNIAFIPWNWRRSAPEVVRLFKENPENYSLSVHGYDHTRAEFGISSEKRLYWKTQQALERMNGHKSMTGIDYDPVMVFPQGIFSEAAMRALKHTDFIAAVSNDVVSADLDRRTITISDMWEVALMGYSFPLFTRRYPWEGIENFAFDALLGKPAIAVIHHDYCSDHCARLVNFVQQVNALPCAPTWRNLGDVIRQSYGQREVSPGVIEVKMYGTELRVENRSYEPTHFTITRREHEPLAIQRIWADSREITWKSGDGRINFETDLNPGENRLIKIEFRHLGENGYNGDNLLHRSKAMVRRYLCEVRDNYITTAKSQLTDLVRGNSPRVRNGAD
jgi:hypothetical protein